MKPSKEGYIPTYPSFVVIFTAGEFNSSVKTLRAFVAGEKMALLDGFSKAPKAYTTVQCGTAPQDHIELNSDLVYVNHSCDPNIAFDLSSPDPAEWHIRAVKRLEKDTILTYFYPSTEWDMDQVFVCECRSFRCLGRIQGAKHLTQTTLRGQQWINPYIWQLIAERDAGNNISDCLTNRNGLQ